MEQYLKQFEFENLYLFFFKYISAYLDFDWFYKFIQILHFIQLRIYENYYYELVIFLVLFR